MHIEPMPDSSGEFGPEKPHDKPCSDCGGAVVWSLWESHCGGYEDLRYRCTRCKHVWWVEGPDS